MRKSGVFIIGLFYKLAAITLAGLGLTALFFAWSTLAEIKAALPSSGETLGMILILAVFVFWEVHALHLFTRGDTLQLMLDIESNTRGLRADMRRATAKTTDVVEKPQTTPRIPFVPPGYTGKVHRIPSSQDVEESRKPRRTQLNTLPGRNDPLKDIPLPNERQNRVLPGRKLKD